MREKKRKEAKRFEARTVPFGSLQGPNSQERDKSPTCLGVGEDRRPKWFFQELHKGNWRGSWSWSVELDSSLIAMRPREDGRAVKGSHSQKGGKGPVWVHGWALRQPELLLGSRGPCCTSVYPAPRQSLPRFGWDTAMDLWGAGVEVAAGWRFMWFRGWFIAFLGSCHVVIFSMWLKEGKQLSL